MDHVCLVRDCPNEIRVLGVSSIFTCNRPDQGVKCSFDREGTDLSVESPILFDETCSFRFSEFRKCRSAVY